jgi:hypothetical protein
VAPGSRHAQGEGKSPRRKRDQWDTKGGKGKSATEGRGASKCEQKGCWQLVKHKGGAGSNSSALKLAPVETDLIILIDSSAAIRRLTWFQRKDFRPHPRRTKDYDIVQEIVLRLDEMGRHGAQTTMVKVHGHTGEPLDAVADAMATEGADRKMESDERPLYEIPESVNLMFVVKEGDNGRKAKGKWSPKVKTCIREHEAERLWDRRSARTWAEKSSS